MGGQCPQLNSGLGTSHGWFSSLWEGIFIKMEISIHPMKIPSHGLENQPWLVNFYTFSSCGSSTWPKNVMHHYIFDISGNCCKPWCSKHTYINIYIGHQVALPTSMSLVTLTRTNCTSPTFYFSTTTPQTNKKTPNVNCCWLFNVNEFVMASGMFWFWGLVCLDFTGTKTLDWCETFEERCQMQNSKNEWTLLFVFLDALASLDFTLVSDWLAGS